MRAALLAGEGANDGAVKPGVEESPLGDLVEFLLERWGGGGGTGGEAGLGGGVGAGAGAGADSFFSSQQSHAVPAATHRLVASAFLDLCVRYHLAVARAAHRSVDPPRSRPPGPLP